MQTTRGLYIFVLASLLILTGCFGTGVIEDTEGQAEDNGNNEQTTEDVGSENIPPLITVLASGEIESPSDPAGDFDVTMYHAMLDLDGTIASAGWDFDLDNQIDHAVTSAQGINVLEIPLTDWVDAGDDEYLITIAFIATDNDGGMNGELITLFGEQFEEEPEEPEADYSDNVYVVEDAAGGVTNGMDDNLVRLQFSTGLVDLQWSFLTITLYRGDITYTCDNKATSDCFASESNADAAWNGNEVLVLQENGAQICDGAGATCDVRITVSYKGNPITGDSNEMAIS